MPLGGRGGRGFDVFFWDQEVDFSRRQPLSQFAANVPSPDPLLTAVHLPPVEIREMIDDDDVSRFKTESPEQAQRLYARILTRLLETERSAMEDLASNLNKQLHELAFSDVARSIAAFIRSDFRLRDTDFHRFVFGDGQLSPDQIQGGLILWKREVYQLPHRTILLAPPVSLRTISSARIREERLWNRLRPLQYHLRS